MAPVADILVVAATARELAPARGWRTLVCGVGPVDAAAATAAALAADRPRAVLHVGIAGARRTAALAPASLVIGTAARYADLGVPADFAPRELRPDARLLDALRTAFPDAVATPIATTARVGGSLDASLGASPGCDVEAMEGFAVLRAAALADVPAIELRAIANEIEESDRAHWHFGRAIAALHAATPTLVEAIAACVN